jgi:hypothetical protein
VPAFLKIEAFYVKQTFVSAILLYYTNEGLELHTNFWKVIYVIELKI